MTHSKDIENEAEKLYPIPKEREGTLNEDIATFEYHAHISAATAERERMSRCMEWASLNGWTYSDGYEKWFDNKTKGGLTTPELLELFLTKNQK